MARVLKGKNQQLSLMEKILSNARWKSKPPYQPKFATGDQNLKDFTGENVVITGGATGLGRSLAIKLGRLNATVAIWDNSKEALNETANMAKIVGGNVRTYSCDLTDRDEIYRVAEKTKNDVGQVTIVINNADIASEKLFLDTPDDFIEKAFYVNVLSHFWTTKAFLPSMIDANRGHLVTISSMAGHMGIHKLTDYCSTKAASMGFLSALRSELEREGSSGVKTTLIFPYFMKPASTSQSASLRIVQALDTEKVADRTIEAIKNQEGIVFMPGWFKFALLPKWITPVSISSLLVRLLIKDLNPEAINDSGPVLKLMQFMKSPKTIEPKKLAEIKTKPELKAATPLSTSSLGRSPPPPPPPLMAELKKSEARAASKNLQ